MKEIPYKEVYDWMKVELHLSNGMRVTGRFTPLRIRRNTIPKSYAAFDIRHDDDDGSRMIQLKEAVLVNHMGTIVCKKRSIPEAFFGVEITDWTFV